MMCATIGQCKIRLFRTLIRWNWEMAVRQICSSLAKLDPRFLSQVVNGSGTFLSTPRRMHLVSLWMHACLVNQFTDAYKHTHTDVLVFASSKGSTYSPYFTIMAAAPGAKANFTSHKASTSASASGAEASSSEHSSAPHDIMIQQTTMMLVFGTSLVAAFFSF